MQEASLAKDRFTAATQEVGRLQSNLAMMRAALETAEGETASSRTEAGNAHARAAGMLLF